MKLKSGNSLGRKSHCSFATERTETKKSERQIDVFRAFSIKIPLHSDRTKERETDSLGIREWHFRRNETRGQETAAPTLYHGWKQITRSLLGRKMSRMYMVVGQTGAIRWILCARSTKCCYIPANSPANPPSFPRFIRDKFDRMHPSPDRQLRLPANPSIFVRSPVPK